MIHSHTFASSSSFAQRELEKVKRRRVVSINAALCLLFIYFNGSCDFDWKVNASIHGKLIPIGKATGCLSTNFF